MANGKLDFDLDDPADKRLYDRIERALSDDLSPEEILALARELTQESCQRNMTLNFGSLYFIFYPSGFLIKSRSRYQEDKYNHGRSTCIGSLQRLR